MDQFTGSGQRRRDRLLMSRQTFVCRRGTTKPPETYDRGHSQDRRGWPAWRFTQAPPASSGSGPRRESELGRLSMVPAMGPTGSHAAHQYLLEAFAGRAAEAGISIQDLRGRRYRDGNLRTGALTLHPMYAARRSSQRDDAATFWAPDTANAEYWILLRPRNVSRSRATPAVSHRLETQRRPDGTLANRPANGSLSADQCRSIGCTGTLRDRDQIEAHRSAAS
jgi:hypothetical protein